MQRKPFFTSDTHFFHRKIQEFCPATRPGKDYLEMTETMIYNWNSVIQKQDTVFHLGDFSFGSYEETRDVLDRLNGHKHFIKGNHDQVILKSDLKLRFESVRDYFRTKIEGVDVVMFHFPIKEWDKMHRGSYHLYGHVHGKDMGLDDRRAMDVGIDARPHGDLMVWSWDEIHEKLKNRPVAPHHDAVREGIDL